MAIALGVALEPSQISKSGDRRNRETVLSAITKARIWVDQLLEGQSLSAIARREGKGERQIRLLVPLAFMPPGAIQELIGGSGPAATVTTLAKNLPLLWGAQWGNMIAGGAKLDEGSGQMAR